MQRDRETERLRDRDTERQRDIETTLHMTNSKPGRVLLGNNCPKYGHTNFT